MDVKKSDGFTIIELMIVVTIIGILAAIAIPLYTSFTTRGKISEAFVLVAPVKTSIEDAFSQTATLPASNDEAGVAAANQLGGQFVQAITVLDGATIEISFSDVALSGRTITFTPTVSGLSLIWACSSTIPESLLPGTCK